MMQREGSLSTRFVACVELQQKGVQVCHKRSQHSRHYHLPLQLFATDTDKATKVIVFLGKIDCSCLNRKGR